MSSISPFDNYPPLSLPPAPLKIQQNTHGRYTVFDPLRRRKVTLTPEEWVRQHFVHHLTHQLGYPCGLLANEKALKVGKVMRRCDTVLLTQAEALPLLIIEYKAPHIAITADVFWQIQSYNSVLHAPYLIVSNGLSHIVCHHKQHDNTIHFLKHIPHYKDLCR